jgi:hypothetical protein
MWSGNTTDIKTLIPVTDRIRRCFAEEYEPYLQMAYRAAEFTKPKNLIGLDKDVPVSEMETLLLEHIDITDDDLRLLAHDRAAQVKDYILDSRKVEPERMILSV